MRRITSLFSLYLCSMCLLSVLSAGAQTAPISFTDASFDLESVAFSQEGASDTTATTWASIQALPSGGDGLVGVAFFDVDRDGLLDLFVAGVKGRSNADHRPIPLDPHFPDRS